MWLQTHTGFAGFKNKNQSTYLLVVAWIVPIMHFESSY